MPRHAPRARHVMFVEMQEVRMLALLSAPFTPGPVIAFHAQRSPYVAASRSGFTLTPAAARVIRLPQRKNSMQKAGDSAVVATAGGFRHCYASVARLPVVTSAGAGVTSLFGPRVVTPTVCPAAVPPCLPPATAYHSLPAVFNVAIPATPVQLCRRRRSRYGTSPLQSYQPMSF